MVLSVHMEINPEFDGHTYSSGKEEAWKSFFNDNIIRQNAYCEVTKCSKGVSFHLQGFLGEKYLYSCEPLVTSQQGIL